MYIADRDNHVIRGMSAVCSFRCENSGLCVGPDQCECAQGWTGIDCTQPICQSSCGQRELCVAPDTCDCIPGYRGEGCLEATCAQQCVNGHCSAPDSCACDPGWFDSNCVSSNRYFIKQFFEETSPHAFYFLCCRQHLYVSRLVATEAIALVQTHVPVLVIGLGLIVELQCVNKIVPTVGFA